MVYRNCSDEYLAWDNTERACVTLKSTDNAHSGVSEIRKFDDIVVRRVDWSESVNPFSEVELRGEVAIILVPAMLVEGQPLRHRDEIQIGPEGWIVNQNVRVVTAGHSVSHFRCPCTAKQE